MNSRRNRSIRSFTVADAAEAGVAARLESMFAEPGSMLGDLNSWTQRLIIAENLAKLALVFEAEEPAEACYRDLIRETPFQFQADMLFISRAIGILAGLATAIDPEFDPWSKALFYAKRFAREELTEDWQGFWEEIFMLGKHVWRIPSHLEQVLTRTKQGALTVQVTLSPEMRRAIHRIDLSVKRFAWMVITALSEQSVAMGGLPVPIPDFTNGAWIDRPPADDGMYSLDVIPE